MSEPNLFAQQETNKRKSAWLVAGFLLFFAWIGFGGDLAFYLYTRKLPSERYHHVFPFIGLIACAIAARAARSAWKHGAKRVLDAAGAQELINPATPELKRLDNVVEEMAIAAGLPKPKIWIVPDPDPNAFATGHDPLTAHLAVTEGLLKVLDRDELQAVVAHEMSHIRNYDIRLMTLLAAMVGAVALLSEMLGRFMRGGGGLGGKGRGGGGGKGKGNPAAAIVLVLWIITLILAPIVSRLLTMGVSRKREYLADASGAQLNRNPLALASALEKIAAATAATKCIAKGAGHMCIVDPAERKLADREGFVGNLLASHPPIRLRLARLRGMGYAAAKQTGTAS
ncbi:MAG TPA: M48 family metallopeptidase [Gemmatimonadales bacterium]|nr:M48 family metallopeptidase [Gemmatimonadales bacterium]